MERDVLGELISSGLKLESRIIYTSLQTPKMSVPTACTTQAIILGAMEKFEKVNVLR